MARSWFRSRRRLAAFAAASLVAAAAAAALGRLAEPELRRALRWLAGPPELSVPPGFRANVFAAGLSGPRFLQFGPEGDLYVADRLKDRIVALRDADGDGVSDETRVFAGSVTAPHSLVFREGAWFVGVPTGVLRLEDRDGDGVAETRATVVDGYPVSGHRTRTVIFHPDGRMLVSVGSSCNVCLETDARRAAIVAYDGPDGSGERIFARGLRNAVGLAFHPETGELWASNNGRDRLGDDLPPETVYVVREGADYGWPRCHAGTLVDPEFGSEGACLGAPTPVVEMIAHAAPLGIAFYTGTAFPEEYRGDLFVALHGSWNRSVPSGYKVVRVPLAGGAPSGAVEDFVWGWLDPDGGDPSGRPVGLSVGPDGALYVSDDKGGYVYRVTHAGG